MALAHAHVLVSAPVPLEPVAEHVALLPVPRAHALAPPDRLGVPLVLLQRDDGHDALLADAEDLGQGARGPPARHGRAAERSGPGVDPNPQAAEAGVQHCQRSRQARLTLLLHKHGHARAPSSASNGVAHPPSVCMRYIQVLAASLSRAFISLPGTAPPIRS